MDKKLSVKEKRKTDKYSQYRDSGMAQTQKPKNFRQTAVKLLSLLKGNVVAVIFVMILTAGSAVLNVIGPKYLGSIMDLINEQVQNKLTNGFIDFTEILKILGTILLIYSVSSVLSFVINFVMAGITQTMITDLRHKINRKMSHLPLKFFDSHNKGDLLSRVTNDIDNINNTFQHNFTQTVSSIVSFVGVFVIMLIYDKTMTFASLAPLPIGMGIALVILNHSKRYFRENWKVTGDINGHIEEMFTHHKIVKVFGHEKQAIAEFTEINDELCEVGRKAQFLSGLLSPLINFANNLGYVFICIIGGYLIIKQEKTVGAITVFMAYSKLFMQPLVDMSNIVNNLQSSLASAERVFEIIEEPEEEAETVTTEITDPKGYVDFENVSFSYDEGKPLYKDFNLNVKPGELVAIVGPTGAGKTTLVNLLMRFYEINSGVIKVDGVNIRDISRKNLRDIFGMVLQETWLFNGTVRDNIKYGNENVSDEEFNNAVRAAKIDQFIDTLPDGFETVIDEDGANLSAGQKQLITIARAILSDPSILILDEATSSVDTRTEIQIQSAMNNLMKGRTNFVIAHRLSTIRDADTIIVIDNGKIVDQGTHEEMLQRDGAYARLYNAQFSNV